MREDEKKVLIEWLIGQRDACDEIHGDGCKREQCITAKIALASLTAQPVGEAVDVGGALLVEWEKCLQEGSQLYTTPPAPSVQTEPVTCGYTLPDGWIKCSDMMPKPGVIVLVYTPPQPCDYPEDVRIGFDWIDPEGDDPTFWYQHGEHYEHYCCVAKPESSFGPSEIAPYTHWMPLPAAPEVT